MLTVLEAICVVVAIGCMASAFIIEFPAESKGRMKLFGCGFALMLLSEVFERL